MNKKLTIDTKAYLQEALHRLNESQEKETVRIEYMDGSWSVKDDGGNETYYFADSYDDAVDWCKSKPWIEDWYENDIDESLTESEMSPEDAEDNKILQGIYAKMQKKVNTKLTPEEQFIMDKYGLSYPYGYSSSSQNPKFKNKSPVVKYPNGGTLPLVDIEDSTNVDKINLPDKVRKMRSRVLNRAPLDRDTKDAQYRYFDVKSHLNNIKNSKQRLKDMYTSNIVDPSYVSSKYQGPATSDSLGADIGFYRDRRVSDRDFLQNSIKSNQDYINKLLRRDESLTEASHPYKGFTVEDEDSHYVIRDFNGTVQSRADTPEEAHQIIDSELGTKRLIVDVNKFSDLDSYCKKFNLSIVNQERAPYMEYTLQGDLNNINTLIDYINRYNALANNN